MSEKNCKDYYIDKDYNVDFKTEIPPELRDSTPYTVMNKHEPNGGLYRGPQINKWYVPHEAVPTTTYFNRVLLKGVHPPPPPQAFKQYPTNQRLGNNYTAMPGIKWYNSAYPRNNGPFNIKVLNDN
jgi:hypothetical protein